MRNVLRCSRIGFVILIVLAMIPQQVQAGLISGPDLPLLDMWQYSGIGFTANIPSTLTGFTFQNQGLADNVILQDASQTILYSVAIPAGVPSAAISISWALSPGIQYYLLQTTNSNSRWTIWGSAAPSNDEITLTDTAIFSDSRNPAFFGVTGTGFWAAFNDITTSGPVGAVPEPATLVLVGIGAAAFSRLRRVR
jgi:hypothetical protein